MSVLRLRDVRLLVGAVGLSAVGDAVLWILLALHIVRASGQVLVIVAPSRAPSTRSALRAASGVFRAGPAFPQTAHHAR